MGLTIPDPLVTVGPTWASNISDSLDIIDAHDHSSGSGVKIPTTGLNINADLSFQSFAASDLRATIYDNLSADPAENASVYFKNGNFFIKNPAGQVVQVTLGNSVNSASGAITGLVSPASASFSAISNTFTWLYDTDLPAKMANSDISLYPYGVASANPLVLAAPTGVTTYTWFFPPTVAPSFSIVSTDETGQSDYVTPSAAYQALFVNSTNDGFEFSLVDTVHIDDEAVTFGKLYPRALSLGPAAIGAVAYTDFGSAVTPGPPVSVASVILNTTGRPVMMMIEGMDASADCHIAYNGLFIEFRVNGTPITTYGSNLSGQQMPPSVMKIVMPAAGTNTFSLRAASLGASAFVDCRLTVYEM